jgi:hypothetical protein
MTNTGCLVAIRAMGPGYHRKTKIAQTEVATQTVTKRPTFAGAFERLGSIGAKRIAPLAHTCARVATWWFSTSKTKVSKSEIASHSIFGTIFQVGRIDPMRAGDAESAWLHLAAMRRRPESEEPQYRL